MYTKFTVNNELITNVIINNSMTVSEA